MDLQDRQVRSWSTVNEAVIECVACREPVAAEGDVCEACVAVALWLVRAPGMLGDPEPEPEVTDAPSEP